LSVCTWVSVTLNGAFTVTTGAAVSVDPVTATLPVVPDSVHSGAPPFAGAAIGHGLASVDVSTIEGGENTSETEEEVGVDEVSVSEPHAASVTTNDAAQATSAAEEDTRKQFTAVTLQPICTALHHRRGSSVAGALYWLTRTGASSARIYYESHNSLDPELRVDVPSAISMYPRDIERCPRAWAQERYRQIVRWSSPETGGHFPSLEVPEYFVKDLQEGLAAVLR